MSKKKVSIMYNVLQLTVLFNDINNLDGKKKK